MRTARCYCQDIQSESFLSPSESNHLCRVLRAEKGTTVELFDGHGTLAWGTVEHSDKKKAVIQVQQTDHVPPPPNPRIILAVSFAKGQRFDWLIEKCTELGVDHIAAVQFEHTVKLGKASAMDRYHKIAITAAKQCRRLYLPRITGPEKLGPTLDGLINQYPENTLLFGDLNGQKFSDSQALKNTLDRVIIIGPEAGLSNNESKRMQELGASGVLVNRNILRIETAAIAFCAVLAASRIQCP
jgi:16S rRNA (uracil1498-N3)-methyltransferase